MRWSNFLTAGSVLWLSCLGAAHTLAQRQTPPGGYLYRGDGRSPQELRAAGGMRPQGEGWENYDPAFDLERHYDSGPNGCGLDEYDDPGFVFRTAYVSAAGPRETAESYGQWLYEFRATPNVLDNGASEGEVMALGGVHWRMIRRYTRMRDQRDNRVDETQWIDNPDYDVELYERGPHAAECGVSTSFPSVLAGQAPTESEDSDSDNSGSEEDAGQAAPQRRLFNAADIWMDRTPGIYELYGPFPPVWQEYAPRDDIPGPDHPAAPEAADAQVGSLLQHYIDMGEQELDRLFPDGNQILQELFRDIRPLGCPSVSGFSSPIRRSVDRRATDKQGCCKILSSFRKKTKASSSKSVVDICGNTPLNPPCTTVDAPRGKCVAVPKDYLDTVSGVKAHEASSICRFYLEADCKGEYFEAGHHAVDLHASRPNFDNKVSSIMCNTATPAAAPAHWEWTTKSQPQLCTRLDQLSLDFQLANNHGSGTYDKIKLAFDGVGQKPHVIAENTSPGDKFSQSINMLDIFGLETVALDQIKRIRILDELTDWTFGGDAWELQGFTLKGRCADSGIHVGLEKFSALNKQLQARPTAPGRFQYYQDWEVWADGLTPADWTARPLCSHFHSMSVNLQIADADWAGTDNSLYAKVGEGRFLIARHPSRREIFTTDISIPKAYKSDTVAVDKVNLVGIVSEGGHDAALPKEVTVYGSCSGATHAALSVKQVLTEWLYDDQQLNIKLAPDMWVKV